MTLFIVGVIEMLISAHWTKAVSKANVALTGLITTVNIFIWYYVIRVVVEDLNNWQKIVPYVLGCSLGAMLGAVEDQPRLARRIIARIRAALRPAARPKAAQAASLPSSSEMN